MKTLLLLIGMFLLYLPAWGEDAGFKHRVLVHYSGPEPEKYLPPLENLLTGEKLNLWVVSSLLPSSASGSELTKEARRFAADLILTVEIRDSLGKDKVDWRLFSPGESKERAGGELLKPKPDWASAAELYWLFLGKPIGEQLGPGSRPWPPAALSAQAVFVILALPGTRVEGLPSGPLVIDKTGKVTVVVDLPASLPLSGHLNGWRTQPQRVFVDHEGQSVTLSQKVLPRWALTFSLNNFEFPSVGEWYSPSGKWFLRAQLDQFLGGLYFGNKSDSTNPWPIQSLPLMTLQLGGGWLWSWPEDQLRFYTAMDVGTRWMFPQFKIFSLEPVVPVTIEPLAGWDFRWTEGQSLYFELGPTIQWAPDVDNFRASLKAHSTNLELQLFGSPFFLEFPFKAKVGYRWSF